MGLSAALVRNKWKAHPALLFAALPGAFFTVSMSPRAIGPVKAWGSCVFNVVQGALLKVVAVPLCCLLAGDAEGFPQVVGQFDQCTR